MPKSEPLWGTLYRLGALRLTCCHPGRWVIETSDTTGYGGGKCRVSNMGRWRSICRKKEGSFAGIGDHLYGGRMHQKPVVEMASLFVWRIGVKLRATEQARVYISLSLFFLA
jgi:hypothetical protein